MAIQPSDEHLDGSDTERTLVMRGLLMILFAFLFGIAETILFISAVIQFFWMATHDGPNESIVRFGKSLANWTAGVVRFQTGVTEDLPFPWRSWE